ncbi:hypothetical protein RJ45_23915 [Photobacterium gaetbulicola]|uniref:Lipoprotein n=1 Tax=Photobacterium gaetbulicola TaxID=1295392 RepID=A0A0B9FVB1_9GAMM|nr:hypothetical protein [Photobacterium gaetbulicola]KHT60054.1 hypothetical protein RJ45_23915 [Photobacterium gaetbulicola]
MNKFTIASVAVATALLAGCGGSSNSNDDKDLDLPEVPTGGEAEVCFNADLWTDGTHVITEKNGDEETIIVKTGASFQGMPNLVSVTEDFGDGEFYSLYFAVNNKSVFNAGSEWAENNGDFEKRVHKPVKPFQLFGLNEAESSSESGDSDREWDWTNDCEPGEQCIGSETEAYDITITFNGFEEVIIDGIAYETCRFEIDDSEEDGDIQHSWIDRQSGVEIQSAWNDGQPSSYIAKYEIDGVQIFPAAE